MDPKATMLAQPAALMNEYERDLLNDVRLSGWRLTSVLPDYEEGDPGFSYTTGMCLAVASPEIIVHGLSGELVCRLIWDLHDQMRAGRVFSAGTPELGLVSDAPVYFFPVGQAGIDEFMLSSKWFYRDRPFPAWQMVWPDQAGTFPWQAGFDESLAHVQPDLTVSGWTHAVQATSGRSH